MAVKAEELRVGQVVRFGQNGYFKIQYIENTSHIPNHLGRLWLTGVRVTKDGGPDMRVRYPGGIWADWVTEIIKQPEEAV